MNGDRRSIRKLVNDLLAFGIDDLNVDIVLCPPSIYLDFVGQLIKGTSIKLGAQDLNRRDKGAYTGEISGPMLRDIGCDYVIIGHCERRLGFGETDLSVAKKFAGAKAHGLKPILCVGETLEQKTKGLSQTVVIEQLNAVLARVGIEGFRNSIVSYEPIWAIGTGRTITPEEGQKVHRVIRERLASVDEEIAQEIRILYGGSVKPHNALDLFSESDIDGGLIGKAALDAKDFMDICLAANGKKQ
jgi:triosephosphate isomerase